METPRTGEGTVFKHATSAALYFHRAHFLYSNYPFASLDTRIVAVLRLQCGGGVSVRVVVGAVHSSPGSGMRGRLIGILLAAQNGEE